jgi:hypothetical protein
MLDGFTFAFISQSGRHVPMPGQDVIHLMNDINHIRETRWTKPDSRSVGDVVALVFAKLKSEPVALVKLGLMKAVRAWYGTDTGRFEFQILLVQIPYLLLSIIGMIYAFQQGGMMRESAFIILLVVLYFWLMTIIALSIVRYMVPAMGLLFVFAPPPVVFLYRYITNRA